ncbi:T9SS type A sorting domain-containing protein [Microscilla marina]|uniref:PKD domain protein n=1 Tax=Microscilla marina ATCC 23134 TaxID=313606 RepID=A1ZXQ5_MICM2|nr:PKD domain-containing protein [Microscilla marina]EAY24833.1 PKD domain protein [Microscilla marina ATCC 23134]
MKTLTLSKTQASFTLLALVGIIGLWLQNPPATWSALWRATPPVVGSPELPTLPSADFLPPLKPTAVAGNVVITAPDFTGAAALCKDGQFVTLPNITLYETTNDSFTYTPPGGDDSESMVITLRVRTANATNFEFKTGPGSVSVTANTSGTNITSISTTDVSPGSVYYFDITFSLLGNDKLDAITISGLQVKALSNTAVAEEFLYAGTATTDGVFTGLTEAGAGGVPNANTTRFAKYGSKDAPADVTFTGLTNVDICAGATFEATDKFNVSAGAGTTNWYSDFALTTQVATGNEVTVLNGTEGDGSNDLIGVNPTTAATLTYYVRREHNGCYSTVKTVTVTVHPIPDVFLTLNLASNQICSDGTIGYTASSPTSDVYTFQIRPSGGSYVNATTYGAVDAAAGTFTSNADVFAAGTYEIRVRGKVNSTGCINWTNPKTFTVVTKPTIPNINAASAVTKGNAIPLTASNNGASRDEERFEGEGVIQVGPNSYEFNTSSLTEGNPYDVTYRYRVGDCWAFNTKTITVQAAQPLFTNITNPNICEQRSVFTLNINAAKTELKNTFPCASTAVTYAVSCNVPGMLSGSPSTSVSSYTFNPTAVPSAPQAVELTVTATHTCTLGGPQIKTSTTTVNIFKALNLVIDQAALNPGGYCDNNNTNIPFTLKDGANVLTDKVTFVLNGANIADGDARLDNANRTFNPQELGAGTHVIKFKYTNVCSDESPSVTIKVTSPANTDFKDITLNTYCNDVGNMLQLAPTIGGVPVTIFESTKGFFTIDGNPQPNGQNFIDLSTLNVGVHTITYVYTDGACSNVVGPRNLTIEAKPTLVLDGLAAKYCQNEPAVTLTGKVTVGANPETTVTLLKASNDYIELRLLPAGTPFVLDEDQLDPSKLSAGTYDVTFVHKETATYLCESRITSSLIIHTPPAPSFNGISKNQQFCEDVGVIPLEPLVNNRPPLLPGKGFFRVWQDSPSLFDKNIVGTGINSTTDLSGVGIYHITYNYLDDNNCNGVSDTVTFQLLSAPQNLKVTTFKEENIAEIKYTATADGVDPLWKWNWDFADGTTADTIVALKKLDVNTNSILNTYTIQAFNGGGCVVSFTKSYVVNFDFTGLCQGSPTQFTDQSSSSTDNFTSWAWDFGDGSTSTAQNPAHTYTNIGTYRVTLTVTTDDGRSSHTIRKRVDIFPGVIVTPTSPYNEDFSGGRAGWIANGNVVVAGVKKDSSSWQLKTPAGLAQHIPADKGNAWVTDNSNNPAKTDTVANYNANEQSYVESPCFNITTLNRPMVSFDYWVDTDLGDDGVVLLYTIDDGKTWFRVGQQNQGLDWYNSRPILGKPGNDFTIDNGDGQGWSGNAQSTNPALGWKTARFGLDGVLQRMDAANLTTRLLRFRVAFGSNADNNPKAKYDGFAFDNFQITNRNRLVLMEYFINQATTNAATLDATTHTYASSKAEAINIHYHTAFPGNDVINNQNPKDPSGRAFHYGIREVPRPTLDGQVRDESITGSYAGTWVDTAFAQRTLRAAPFLINISQPTATNGTLTVSATINAIEALDRKVVMHIAVIEDTVNIEGNNYYNAVRKMLPDAAGTFRAQSWVVGDSQTLNETWNYSAVTGLSPNHLRVVVFVADYETNEIYQAEVSDVLANGRENDVNDENQVTGVVDDLKSGKWSIFPNPAADQLNISFPANGSAKSLTEDIKWEVVNVSGQTVKQGRWARGSRQWSLRVNDLASGVYIIKLSNRQFTVQRRFEKH